MNSDYETEQKIQMKTQKRRLMWHGMLLFLLGLITGLFEQRFTNVRMGLAAHLEGVMNSILLLAIAAASNEVRLRPSVKVAAYCTGPYGHLCELASVLDSCGFRHRGRFSNHFSRVLRQNSKRCVSSLLER